MSPWKILYASVQGPSHIKSGQPCQDYSLAATVQVGGESVMVGVCSDGAGSSKFADEGSSIACRSALSAVRERLASIETFAQFGSDDLADAFEFSRRQVALAACGRSTAMREFACTLLVAVAGSDWGIFAQIGDGAIVVSESNGVRPIFWPQSGEYANTTHFLTDVDYLDWVQKAETTERVKELAMFTDGVQCIALNYSDRTAHEPFFRPMFDALKAEERAESLDGALKQFLGSKPVTDRTDDDCTLLLAVQSGT